jgi:hypothetical protein
LSSAQPSIDVSGYRVVVGYPYGFGFCHALDL